jgi:penicillin-binding protein 1A
MKDKILNFLLALYGLLLLGIILLRQGLSILSIPKPSPPTPSYYAKVLWRNFALLICFVWFYFQAVDLNLFWLFGKSPSLSDLEKPKISEASEVYSADGILLGKYYRENRSTTDYRQISPNVIKALLATEDINFTGHTGVDMNATISIVYYMLKGDRRGGSTITQQLAKNLYKTRRKENFGGILSYIPGVKTLVEKTKEWLTAIKLERAYTKEEILSMYLNTVDFGSNSYGIRTAAQTFFHTTPGRLKAEEAAVLIGMLKATTTYNPRRNYEKSFKRRNTVLSQMHKYGFLSRHDLDSLSALPIRLRIVRELHPDGVLDYYGTFLTRKLTEWADSSGYDIYSDGLRIRLTIDSRLQEIARQSVEEHMSGLQKRFDEHWRGQNPWRDEKGREIEGFIETMVQRTDAWKSLARRYGNQQDSIQFYLNKPRKMAMFTWKGADTVMMSTMDSLRYCKKLLHAGFMVMDPYQGQIKAWIGGINYDFFKYDHVIQSMRQPGSTFKSFVYGAAMERGFSPCQRIQDRYMRYEYDEDSAGIKVHRVWTPGNATGYYSGSNMTLRHAIGRSINSVAVQLTAELGKQEAEKEGSSLTDLNLAVQKGAHIVADFARKCGIKTRLDPKPSIGLGSSDVSVFDMVGAYSVFLNSGFWKEPSLVARIETKNGEVIREFSAPTQKVMSEEAAYRMVHMLKGTLEEPLGTAQALFDPKYWVYGNDYAGKTGTSSNQSDGWFMGLTKDFVGGVWVGAEERCVHFRSLRQGEGSKTALPVFGLFVKKVYSNRNLGYKTGYFPRKKFPIPGCPTRLPKKAADSTSGETQLAEPLEEELILE